MTLNKEEGLELFERQVQQRFQSARQRFVNANETQQKRYYKGQVDALQIVLREIDTIKFELGMELMHAEESAAVVQPAIAAKKEVAVTPLALEEPQAAPAPKRTRQRKQPAEPKAKRGRKPSAVAEPAGPYDDLIKQALKLDVLKRRASWYYHDLLPNKNVKGTYQLNKAFEENVAFREAIRAACALQPATIPVVENVIEQPQAEQAAMAN